MKAERRADHTAHSPRLQLPGSVFERHHELPLPRGREVPALRPRPGIVGMELGQRRKIAPLLRLRLPQHPLQLGAFLIEDRGCRAGGHLQENVLEQAHGTRLVGRIHLRRRDRRARRQQLLVKLIPLELRRQRPVGLEHEKGVIHVRALGKLHGVDHVVDVQRRDCRERLRPRLNLLRVDHPVGELFYREILSCGRSDDTFMRREGIAQRATPRERQHQQRATQLSHPSPKIGLPAERQSRRVPVRARPPLPPAGAAAGTTASPGVPPPRTAPRRARR